MAANENLKKRAYETARQEYLKEKARELADPSPIASGIKKYGRKYITDPIFSLLSRGTGQTAYNDEELRARKEILGYKKGGAVCRGGGRAVRGVKKAKFY